VIDLKAPLTAPAPWVFRTLVLTEIHANLTQKGVRTVFHLTAWREVTVIHKLAIDAKRDAAMKLGVPVEALELVSCPI
jgi:hypothetical protein